MRVSRTPTYRTWDNMRTRCFNRNNENYKYYGARGITVCPQWNTFAAFLADMGERPPGKTLDRIDPNGNYEPGNCRWATPATQRWNIRPTPGKSVRPLKLNGRIVSLSEACTELRVAHAAARRRLAAGVGVFWALYSPGKKGRFPVHVIRTCVVCGSGYEPSPCRRKTGQTCSPACKAAVLSQRTTAHYAEVRKRREREARQ